MHTHIHRLLAGTFTIFTLLLLSFTDVHTQTKVDQSRTYDYPQGGAALGQGWNTNQLTLTQSKCVDGSTVKTQPGQQTMVKLERVSSKFDFDTSMSVSVDSQVKALVGDTTDKTSFSAGIRFNSAYLNISAVSTVDAGSLALSPQGDSDLNQVSSERISLLPIALDTQAWQSIPDGSDVENKSIRLGEKYAQMAKDDLQKFRRACGDGYVASIAQGGQMTALLTFTTTDASAQASYESSLSGAFAASSVGSKMKGKLDTAVASNSLKFNMLTIGGIDTGLDCNGTEDKPDTGCLWKALSKFPTEVHKHPRFLSMTIMPYTELENWPGGVLDIKPLDPLAKLARYYQDFASIYDTINWLRQDYQWNAKTNACTASPNHPHNGNKCVLWNRGGFDTPELQADIQDDIQNILNEIKQIAGKCTNSIDNCTLTNIGIGENFTYDPWAYRAKLPMLYSSAVTPDQFPPKKIVQSNIRQYWLQNLRDNRCELDKSVDVCPSNKKIRSYDIDVIERVLPPQPRGSYRKTCKDFKLVWNGKNHPQFSASCSTGKWNKDSLGRRKSKIYKNNSWDMTLKCPSNHITNCTGNFKCGGKC